MWFFMYNCYIFSLLTIICLFIAFVQSFTNFLILSANHVTFIILTSIVYFFTETLIIFFFVGTGVSVKEYTQAHHLSPDFHKRSINIKRKVYPPQLLNIFLMTVVFILVGAVDTFRIPQYIYQILFGISILHYLKIKVVQNQCFRDNTQIILEMSGIKK